jgi:hypothetical protein
MSGARLIDRGGARARHATDQQTRVKALLLEAIAALADLLGVPANPPPS